MDGLTQGGRVRRRMRCAMMEAVKRLPGAPRCMVALVGDALRSNKRQATIPSARFRRSAFSSCESTAALEHKVKAFY
jgi:hypothetical protein